MILILSLPEEREVIVTTKVITVTGKTSIGSFKCDYAQTGINDTLFIDHTKSRGDLVFDIPVQGFSCGNFLINKDFRSTIKAGQYPKAKVQVRSLRSGYGHYTCDLTVHLVGKKLEYKDLVLKRVPNGLTAHLTLSFDELDLEAPKKMGGLIKVDEELRLNFTLGF
jgi:hypothetical protein